MRVKELSESSALLEVEESSEAISSDGRQRPMKFMLLVCCAVAVNALALIAFATKFSQGHVVPGFLKQSKVISLQETAASEGGKQRDLFFVDAGSTGSKVLAFTPEKTSVTFLTQCAEALRKPSMNMGIAAMGYSKEECEWQVGTDDDDMRALGNASNYAPELLSLLAATYKKASGKETMSDVVGGGQAVPILATAGMRLLSKEVNDVVWGSICDRSHSGLKFAPRGDKCGTIPGTTEAYYEFLANAVHGKSQRLTGTFTVGGASSQIAIPLKTEEDVKAFEQLKADITEALVCSSVLLENGEKAPVFNTNSGATEGKECVDDYITIRPADKIHASATVEKNNIAVPEIKGIGLISFLGLQGRGTFVAGGLNMIEKWAEQNDCAQPGANFAMCHGRLMDALERDVMWSHVTKFFRKHTLSIHDFSYNTYAAVPKYAGLSHVSGGDEEGWELAKELEEKCGSDGGVHFGYKNSNSCMKALYTSLYTVSFFGHNSEAAKDAVSAHHQAVNLHFSASRDWAEGIQEAARGQGRRLSQQETRALDALKLLHVPLERTASNYIEGARLHMAESE